MMRAIALAVTAVLVLGGCAGKAATKDVASSSTPTAAQSDTATAPPSAQRYQTVVALRDAAVAAGLPCPMWDQDNVVQVAAESGSCSDDTVLSTYATDADLQTAVTNMQGLAEMAKEQNLPESPILIGPNWIINAPTVAELAAVLGGTVDR